tara:strand:+ start:5704 stop:8271 length:2568 start_codon:yes stop_codon:yes gene_type:complete
MAVGKKEMVLVFKVAAAKAQKTIKSVGTGLKTVGSSSKIARGGLNMLSVGFKKVGMALKAAGIGLFITILSQMTGLWSSNQKASDTFSRIMIKLKPVFKAVGDAIAFVAGILESLIDMFTSAVGWIGKLIGVNMSATSSAADFADALVDQRNKVKLLESELALLQLQYQRDAELMRQIRDDEMLSIDDRIKANFELGKILEEQLRVERAAAGEMLLLAEMELSMDKENIDLQKALLDAKVKLAEIDERITGQRSEQLVNLNSLERERDAQNKEAAAKRQEQLKKEQEMLEGLLELQNEDIKQKKEINRTINEQFENAEEQNKKIIEELERKKQVELNNLKNSKAIAAENVKIQQESIEQQQADLEEEERIRKIKEQQLKIHLSMSQSSMKFHLQELRQLSGTDFLGLDERAIKNLQNTQINSLEDLEEYKKKFKEVIEELSDKGKQIEGSGLHSVFGEAILNEVGQVQSEFTKMYGEIGELADEINADVGSNAQGIIDISQESLNQSNQIITGYKSSEAEIISRYDQEIADAKEGLIDTTTILQEQANERLLLHFETAKEKEIRLAKEKYASLLGDAENNAEATADLKQEEVDALAAIEQKYIDEEERKKKDFYNFKETEEISARQKELNDLTAHLDQILALEGLTDEERLLAQEEFIRRSDEINDNHDALELEKKENKRRELEDMALQGMNTIVKISGESAKKEIAELEKKFKNGEISEEEFNKKKNAIEKKQAKKERNAALIQIAVDTARGISAAVAAGAGLTFPANLGAIASGVLAVLSGVAGAKAAMNDASGVDSVDTGGDDDTEDEAGGVPRVTFGAVTSDAPPVQAYVVESDVSGAQALQSELDLQSTL